MESRLTRLAIVAGLLLALAADCPAATEEAAPETTSLLATTHSVEVGLAGELSRLRITGCDAFTAEERCSQRVHVGAARGRWSLCLQAIVGHRSIETEIAA